MLEGAASIWDDIKSWLVCCSDRGRVRERILGGGKGLGLNDRVVFDWDGVSLIDLRSFFSNLGLAPGFCVFIRKVGDFIWGGSFETRVESLVLLGCSWL